MSGYEQVGAHSQNVWKPIWCPTKLGIAPCLASERKFSRMIYSALKMLLLPRSWRPLFEVLVCKCVIDGHTQWRIWRCCLLRSDRVKSSHIHSAPATTRQTERTGTRRRRWQTIRARSADSSTFSWSFSALSEPHCRP